MYLDLLKNISGGCASTDPQEELPLIQTLCQSSKDKHMSNGGHNLNHNRKYIIVVQQKSQTQTFVCSGSRHQQVSQSEVPYCSNISCLIEILDLVGRPNKANDQGVTNLATKHIYHGRRARYAPSLIFFYTRAAIIFTVQPNM